jgi:hypothetical protein
MRLPKRRAIVLLNGATQRELPGQKAGGCAYEARHLVTVATVVELTMVLGAGPAFTAGSGVCISNLDDPIGPKSCGGGAGFSENGGGGAGGVGDSGGGSGGSGFGPDHVGGRGGGSSDGTFSICFFA